MTDLKRVDAVTKEIVREVHELFTYKKWDENQVTRGTFVRDALVDAFLVILEQVPSCPTRSRALNLIIDCRMLCNAAITHEGKYE
jgi:hypothetical protein